MDILRISPLYSEANIAKYICEHHEVDLKEKLAGTHFDYVLLPKGETELISTFVELLPEARHVELDPTIGFVYANETAVVAALKNQMPVPSAERGLASAVSITNIATLLADAGKTWVWIDNLSRPVQVEIGATAAKLCELAGVSTAKGVYFGHPTSRIVAADDSEVTVSEDVEYVHVFTKDDCMAAALAEVSARYNKECCGRCVFGHEGSHQARQIAQDIISKRAKSTDIALLKDLYPVMETQSLCELGSSLARLISDLLGAYLPEIEAHITKKQCPTGSCSAFVTYHILPASCTGCMECVDACEEEAIMSKKGFVHVIDQKLCTACGKCVSACDEKAIVAAGAEKPRTPPRPIPCKKR